jgi:hypothetical protein
MKRSETGELPAMSALDQKQKRLPSDVRFNPNSGRQFSARRCPLCAISGLVHRTIRPYSITWSARATRLAGTSSPIAFAALTLMTNSNRAGCSTGMSPGLAPRRIFTTMRARWRNMSAKRGP